MSFKNVLNKMGLVEDDVPVKKVQASTAAKTSIPTPEVSRPSVSYETTVDPTIKDMLEQSLQENKLSGFDYLKFTSAVEEMKSAGTPEDARYKMAFFAAKQLGVDKNNLLQSGSHYLDVLKQDEDDFNNDCSQYDKKEVQSRESKITQIEATIESLTKQLAQLQQDHTSLSQELLDEKAKLDSRKNAFQVTLQTFRATINTNIEKINQYL